MLVVLSGLPGTSKTTIGKALAAKRSATYVRIDDIEHALTQDAKLRSDIGPAGYIVAFAIALSNLKLGNLVIGDCVNPVSESRRGWRDVAERAEVRLIEIEVVCSDERQHQLRVDGRAAEITGFELPQLVIGQETQLRAVDITEASGGYSNSHSPRGGRNSRGANRRNIPRRMTKWDQAT